MTIFIFLILAFVAFAFYRYRQYQKQREIEEMAADAQAYVSSEVVELLQRFKTIATENDTAMSAQQKRLNCISKMSRKTYSVIPTANKVCVNISPKPNKNWR